MQIEQGVTTSIQNFLLAMVGLSVASERVTETVKQWVCPRLNPADPNGNTNVVQVIAIGSGILVTALSTLDPLNITHGAPFQWNKPVFWLSWVVTGILVSGGSAFWNHLLDILQATKVQKEQAAYGPAPQQSQQTVTSAVMVTSVEAPAPAGGD